MPPTTSTTAYLSMSNYTSMSERNSADKSADEHASTDYTQVASYAEQGEKA